MYQVRNIQVVWYHDSGVQRTRINTSIIGYARATSFLFTLPNSCFFPRLPIRFFLSFLSSKIYLLLHCTLNSSNMYPVHFRRRSFFIPRSPLLCPFMAPVFSSRYLLPFIFIPPTASSLSPSSWHHLSYPTLNILSSQTPAAAAIPSILRPNLPEKINQGPSNAPREPLRYAARRVTTQINEMPRTSLNARTSDASVRRSHDPHYQLDGWLSATLESPEGECHD